MLVTCPACSAKFQLPDAKIAGRRARLRCKKCGQPIAVDGTGLGLGPAPAPDETVPLSPAESEALAGRARRLPPKPAPPPPRRPSAAAEEEAPTRLMDVRSVAGEAQHGASLDPAPVVVAPPPPRRATSLAAPPASLTDSESDEPTILLDNESLERDDDVPPSQTEEPTRVFDAEGAPQPDARSPDSHPSDGQHAAVPASADPLLAGHLGAPLPLPVAIPTAPSIAKPAPARRRLHVPRSIQSSWGLYLFLVALVVTSSLVGTYLLARPSFERGIAAARATLGMDGPEGASGPPFDSKLAAQELERLSKDAGACAVEGGPKGLGRVRVLFHTSGIVTSAALSPPFHQSIVEPCLLALIKKARVPAFGGQPIIVTKTFRVD